MSRLLSLIALVGLALVATSATAATPDEIARWVKQLDSDDFKVRQSATTKLIEAGPAAIGPVARAAESDSLEVTSRCMTVLGKLLESDDAATKTAAKKALEDLVKSKNTAAASRANEIINPKKPEAPAPRFGGRAGGFGIAGPGMRISVKRAADGTKTIEAQEGGRKTKIEEDAKGKIKMEVTEKVDGKEKTKKYEAENVAELKKKHPDAYKLYEKYSKGRAGGIILRVGGGGVIGGAKPFRIGVIPKKALDDIEAARKKLEEATENLRKLAGESRIDPERVKKLAEQIETAKKQIEEAQRSLPK